MSEDGHEEPGPPEWPRALEQHRPHPGGSGQEVPRTHQLCRALVSALELDGAAVAMITDTGERDLVHATDPVIAHLDELQFTLAEGPCLDAHGSRAVVSVADLDDAAAQARWPVFSQEASSAGAAAVFALPMVAAGVCFGVLELYRRTPGGLDAGAWETLEVAREAIIRVALDELLGSEASGDPANSWPARLTAAHAAVHQAAGMVSVHLGVSVDSAMARLRAMAYSEDTSLTELANRVLAGTTRVDEDAAP